jgi:hypothetical protein
VHGESARVPAVREKTAEAKESFGVLVAVEGAKQAGEIVGGGDLRAEAMPERFAFGVAANVVIAARAGRLGHELELAGSRLQLDHRPRQVAQVELLPVDAAGVQVVERTLEPDQVLLARRLGMADQGARARGVSQSTVYLVVRPDIAHPPVAECGNRDSATRTTRLPS